MNRYWKNRSTQVGRPWTFVKHYPKVGSRFLDPLFLTKMHLRKSIRLGARRFIFSFDQASVVLFLAIVQSRRILAFLFTSVRGSGENCGDRRFSFILQANNINAPETQQPKSSSNRDSFLGSSDPNTVPHRSYTQLPPSELPLQPSHSSCPEDLPSAPSNSTLSSYNQNSQSSADNPGYPSNSPSHQSLYSHTSGVSFDPSSGNDRMPGHHVVGTYSYPSDSPGFSSSPPPSHNSYPSAPQDMQGGPNPTHFYQPSHWPNPSANDSASAYPSFFPPAGSGFQLSTPQYPTTPQAPQGVLRHSEPPPLARTGSAPVGPDSSTGYSLNGNYNSDFKPSAGAVAEAHKASRFAVSALAFDDIPTAISYLTKSLELLTSPSVSI